MHPLDNSAWHALLGPHQRFASGSELARRYDPEVSVFAALPDEPTPEPWQSLAELVGPGQLAVLFRDQVEGPADWKQLFRIPTVQMVAPPGLASEGNDVVELAAEDADEMLALTEQTRPGPFSKRTRELGTYLGVRDGGALVAMAGERIRLAGFTEISAVCTAETHRGRGLGEMLVRAIARRIAARGDTPFLHVAAENTTAIRLYERLGFTTRRHVVAVGLFAPK